MAENYEFISAANLPTTDAKEVDVICVEGDELKRKPGASIGGGGGYAVRLPADTVIEGESSIIQIVVEESYDNFIDLLHNGGSVQIDLSAVEAFSSEVASFGMVTPMMWMMQNNILISMAIVPADGIGVFSFLFPNGTWTPPAAE